MSRPLLLVFLLLLIIFTSQIDWNQQIVNEVEANPNLSRKQLDHVNNQESVKEKIILSQEKSIQKLNKLVQSLQEQLVQCRVINGDIDDPASPLAELLHELEQQQLLDS
ncbi:Hyaluronan mediated motility receptor-related family protein [Heracleum sosnowskyi]|uniref:Hyaluronan mediated motility receptor-related family protein n=1 Tax=Heracleum sosnowskyi TaxID=360622 RepID=A0AAD8IQ82_9APIA|nr:Hyaluronan mediated motility receptor-related family protein [Heracleum sosnowskyi]